MVLHEMVLHEKHEIRNSWNNTRKWRRVNQERKRVNQERTNSVRAGRGAGVWAGVCPGEEWIERGKAVKGPRSLVGALEGSTLVGVWFGVETPLSVERGRNAGHPLPLSCGARAVGCPLEPLEEVGVGVGVGQAVAGLCGALERLEEGPVATRSRSTARRLGFSSVPANGLPFRLAW